MGALNMGLTLLVVAIFTLGMYRAGTVYIETIDQMQPYLSTIEKGMK